MVLKFSSEQPGPAIDATKLRKGDRVLFEGTVRIDGVDSDGDVRIDGPGCGGTSAGFVWAGRIVAVEHRPISVGDEVRYKGPGARETYTVLAIHENRQGGSAWIKRESHYNPRTAALDLIERV